MTGGLGKGGQSPEDGAEPEGAELEEAQRCPICLGPLGRADLGVPEGCSHVFCLACILHWAEMVRSCPVDRKSFNAIYKRDAVLGCIKIPVKAPSKAQLDTSGCKDIETVSPVLTKGNAARVVERTNAKVRCLIRKCDADDSAVLRKKKVRGELCCARPFAQHSPPSPATLAGVPLATLTRCTAEPLVVPEEEPGEEGWKPCREVQERLWLRASVPVPSKSLLRHSLPPVWSTSTFPLRPLSPLSTSPVPLGSGHFASKDLANDVASYPVFQGRVCAVTCPKGEERKGTRSSGSKGTTKQTEALTTRRSARHSRAEDQDPASSQSQQSDSDPSSPTGWSAKAGRASEASETQATTSKGKQAANQKPRTKRKGGAKKRASRRALKSPVESEEEEEKGRSKEENEGGGASDSQACLSPTQEDGHSPAASGHDSEGHGTIMENQTSPVEDGNSSPLIKQHQEEEKELEVDSEPEDNLEREEKSPSSGKVQQSPGRETEDDQKSTSSDEVQKSPGGEPGMEENEEEPVSPGQGADSGGNSPPSPSVNSPCSPGATELDTSDSPSTAQPLEADMAATEVDAAPDDIAELKPEAGTESEPDESEGNAQVACKLLESGSSSPQGDLLDETSVQDQGHTEDSLVKDSKIHDAGFPQDNTDAVPMDCDSPNSERGDQVSNMAKKSDSAATVSASLSSEKERSNDSSQAQDRKSDSSTEQRSQERRDSRQRRSRFHSPTTTWSPKRESKRETSRRSRSRDRGRNTTSPSRTHSRERESERERGSSRRNRSRERGSRRRTRSRSRSGSRSRSRSRTRPSRRAPSQERADSGGQSPRKRDSWSGEGWRGGRGFRDSNWRNTSERSSHFSGREEPNTSNGSFPEMSPERGRSENPDWVKEKTRADAEARGQSGDTTADSWCRGGQGGWSSEPGRGAGRGRGTYWASAQPRNSFSGTSNNSGNDAYSRFNENRPGGKWKEPDSCDNPVDRSGWSSASSWAVRRTLPADVQNYYSRRERGPASAGGGWNRQEEDQTAAGISKQSEPPQSEPSTQPPAEAPPPPLNMVPHQLNVLGTLRYPLGQRAPPVSLQPSPFGVPPQVPVHLHPAGPLLQVPAAGGQGLPPPPPPPPPMQQGSLTVMQADSRPPQVVSSFPGFGKGPFKAVGLQAQTHPQTVPSMALPSSTTQPSTHSKAYADSSKKEKKQQIQERAANEVKNAIKPYYQNKDITKEEYKEIVRKAVEKICHSKSGEVNADKVANLVKAYVDKYKHARKK